MAAKEAQSGVREPSSQDLGTIHEIFTSGPRDMLPHASMSHPCRPAPNDSVKLAQERPATGIPGIILLILPWWKWAQLLYESLVQSERLRRWGHLDLLPECIATDLKLASNAGPVTETGVSAHGDAMRLFVAWILL